MSFKDRYEKYQTFRETVSPDMLVRFQIFAVQEAWNQNDIELMASTIEAISSISF